MKKIIFYILSIVALAGCMERSEFVPENSVPAQDMKEYVAPLELTLGGPQTKSYDEDLNWTWEESDKIYGYQVAGGKSVNTLSFVEDNRFGTPEFAYASQEAATFHFVYAGDATIDESAEGNRGIRQDSRQSGEWRPVLVGSAVGKTISEVMNDEAEINMEHLSAALEVRLWKEGVDKNNLTDADKKNIVYAELMSDTENFLLDIVPVSNQDGTVSYTDREKGEDEEDGGYIRTEYVNSPVAVFNVAPHAENYQAGALRLAVVDENGDRYVLNVPSLNFVAGERTILNVEWKTPTSAHLPDGPTFNSTVDAFMTGKGITEIKFITNSATTSEDVLVEGSIYLVQNGQTLEIHTAADQFVANSDCQYMFSGDNSTTFDQIVSIDFGANFNTRNVTNMSYMFDSCKGLTSLDVSKFNTENVTNMYSMFSACWGLTSLDVSKFNTQNVTNMRYMFSGCKGLTSLDLSNFNTQNVTNMSSMFSTCMGLTSLDLSNFNTQNVTDMRYMFSSCKGLTSLDLSKFNTQNVTNMGSMFSYCSGLTSLDVSNFNTQNVTNMSSMFSFCSGLTSLDVSNFNTQNVTDMGSMFSYCSGLTSLDISKFNTQNVTNMSSMFLSCSGLTSLDLSKFNTQNVTNMRSMFSLCSGLTSLDLSSFSFIATPNITDIFYYTGSNAANKPIPIYVSAEGKSYIETTGTSWIKYNYDAVLILKDAQSGSAVLLPTGKTFNATVDAFMTDKGITQIKFVTNSATTSEDVLVEGSIYMVQKEQTLEIHTNASQFMANIDCQYMFSGENSNYTSNNFKQIVSIDFGDNFNTQNVTDMVSMFSDCSGLTSLDVSNFNTTNVTDMSTMFSSCSDLTSLDVSKFNTQNVTDMSWMFSNCSDLTSLDVSNFNTQNVTDMGWMFSNCSDLTSLDVSNFNTTNVTDMSSMFSICSGLTSLDLSNFNTTNVTDMSSMFSFCSGLTSLGVSKFNTENVTDMYGMFYNCSGLTSLDVSNFNTQNVTDMSCMFRECSKLTSLDLSKFNTQKVTDMRSMFYNCSGLTSLDVINFNTQKVTHMGYMFFGCSSLTSLDVINFNTQKVTYMGYMFSGCSSFTSLDISSFSFLANPSISDIFNSTGSNAANKPIPIYVSAVGKSYIEANGFTSNENCELVLTDKAYLPTGETFNITVNAFMAGKGITKIKFVTNSATTSEDALVGSSIFLVQNGETLEIHTHESQFVAHNDCQNMFSGQYNNFKDIVSIDFGDNFNTQNVTNMSSMFYYCKGLTSLDVSKFNTQNVTNMSSMFSNCVNITSLDVSKFNTQNVTDMSKMFNLCWDLTSLDVSKFNTQNVTDMSLMFYYCDVLTSLDVSKFNTQNVTNMRSMFNSCSGLTSLDISKFNTQNVKDMRSMFYNCSGLTSLDVINFNTQNVTDMSVMFYGCSGLTSLDVSKFNTTNVNNMSSMFSGCSGLTSLDVSNFNTQKVTNMNSMFKSCSSFTSLDISSFSFLANPSISDIFNSTGSNAANKPIPIYVTEEGKSYIETTGGSSIDSEYATLIIKSVGI